MWQLNILQSQLRSFKIIRFTFALIFKIEKLILNFKNMFVSKLIPVSNRQSWMHFTIFGRFASTKNKRFMLKHWKTILVTSAVLRDERAAMSDWDVKFYPGRSTNHNNRRPLGESNFSPVKRKEQPPTHSSNTSRSRNINFNNANGSFNLYGTQVWYVARMRTKMHMWPILLL